MKQYNVFGREYQKLGHLVAADEGAALKAGIKEHGEKAHHVEENKEAPKTAEAAWNNGVAKK